MNEKYRTLQQKKDSPSTARTKMNDIRRISTDNERRKWEEVM